MSLGSGSTLNDFSSIGTDNVDLLCNELAAQRRVPKN